MTSPTHQQLIEENRRLREACKAAMTLLIGEFEEPHRTVFWKAVDALKPSPARVETFQSRALGPPPEPVSVESSVTELPSNPRELPAVESKEGRLRGPHTMVHNQFLKQMKEQISALTAELVALRSRADISREELEWLLQQFQGRGTSVSLGERRYFDAIRAKNPNPLAPSSQKQEDHHG